MTAAVDGARSPRRCAVVITLHAISPLLATSSLAMSGAVLPLPAAVASARQPASAKILCAVLPCRIAAGAALDLPPWVRDRFNKPPGRAHPCTARPKCDLARSGGAGRCCRTGARLQCGHTYARIIVVWGLLQRDFGCRTGLRNVPPQHRAASDGSAGSTPSPVRLLIGDSTSQLRWRAY